MKHNFQSTLTIDFAFRRLSPNAPIVGNLALLGNVVKQLIFSF